MSLAPPPCDEGVIRRARPLAPCEASSEPWIIAAAAAGSGMAFLDSTVLNVALPAIQADLGATASETQWVYGSFALVVAALLLVGGSLGDHLGRKRVYALGVALFGAASAWSAFAAGPGQLIAARAIKGAGGALMVPGALAIIGASFGEERRTRAIGLWSALSGLAMAVGPVLGGLLVENASWRLAFLINPPVAALVLVVVLRHVPESRDPAAGRLDFAGAALATLGLGGLVYGLIRAPQAGFVDPLTLLSLGLGVGGLALFVLAEGRGRYPMMPLSLFGSRTFDGASLYTLFFYVALTASLYLVPFLMVQVHGHPATVAGAVFLPFVAAALLFGRLSAGIVGRYGLRTPLVVASLATALGFLLFAVPGADGAAPHWSAFVPAMVAQGFGMALVIAPLTTAALDSVEGDHAGLASGVNNAVARTAGLLAVAVFGIVLYAAFSTNLDARVADLPLSADEFASLQEEKTKLGAAQPPKGVDAATAERIEHAVAESFVAGFRMVMFLAAGLALVSAAVGAILIGEYSDPW
ncbi:MFS transporter [soil metagenome]